MSKYWNKTINQTTPYVAGEQPKAGEKVIKLNTNENPFPPSPAVAKAIAEFDVSTLRLYPDTNATPVVNAIAAVENVKPSQVFVGNGSDEVLALCFQTFFEKKADTDLPVLTPEFSYSFYPVYEEFYGIRSKKIPLREDYRLEPSDYAGVPNCGIAIANPNAPTSRAISLDDVAAICKANPDSVVLIDEAYAYFEENYETAVSLLPEFPNLCVVRTTSKSYSLAGIRIGYAIASEELIEGLLRARDSFNSYPIDRLAQAVGAAAISDVEYHRKCREELLKIRKYTEEELKAIGFEMPESSSNFLFAKPPVCISAETLYKNLRAKGILVRYFSTPGINDRLRISIGTQEEMEEFIRNVKEEIANVKNS
jgi:histidinol-phosphate aminotransferase